MTDFRPMKAHDVSRLVAWGTDNPYAGIGAYLTADYAAELKIDGARFYLALGAERNEVGNDTTTYNGQLPHLTRAVTPELAGTVLDGELTWRGGMPTSVVNSLPHRANRLQAQTEPAVFYAFDVLAVNGTDVTGKPYDTRREMLEMIVAAIDTPHVRLVGQLPATAESIETALSDGYEGVMLKRRTSTIRPDAVSREWVKVKRTATGEFFVIGSNPGDGGNTGKVGSLRVAWWDADADRPRYCADVGGGMTDRFRSEITDPDNPGEVRPDLIGAVIEVTAQQVTPSGRLRSPRFVRLRPDKVFTDCDRRQIDLFPQMRSAA